MLCGDRMKRPTRDPIVSTASQRFLQQHTLPATYLRQAERYVDPLIPQIRKSSMQCRPLMLGINGCQGSGKTTLTAYLSLRLEEEGMRVANLSLDDFYQIGRAHV